MQALAEYARLRETDLEITVYNIQKQNDTQAVERFTDADKNREVILPMVSLSLGLFEWSNRFM